MRKKLLVACIMTSSLTYAAKPQDLEKLALLREDPVVRLDLSNTDLRMYPFIPEKINLEQANMSHSNLSGVDLSKMNLSGADLSYSDLSNAKLNQANLAGANLEYANLTGAEMKQSNLSNVNFYKANLTATHLQESSLHNANLTCANLNQADLSKTIFTGATISGATFVNTYASDITGYNSITDVKVACS